MNVQVKKYAFTTLTQCYQYTLVHTIKQAMNVLRVTFVINTLHLINTAMKIYIALIQPYLDYCSAVCGGLNATLNDKLQKLEKTWLRGSSPNLDVILDPANCLVDWDGIIF